MQDIIGEKIFCMFSSYIVVFPKVEGNKGFFNDLRYQNYLNWPQEEKIGTVNFWLDDVSNVSSEMKDKNAIHKRKILTNNSHLKSK